MARQYAIGGPLGASFANDSTDDEFMVSTSFVAETTVAAAAGGLVKVWTGSAWMEKSAKVWTGSAWVQKPVKVWNGSAWVLS